MWDAEVVFGPPRENVMKTTTRSLLACLALSGLVAGGPAIAADFDPSTEKPYRVLVVIGDQWDAG